MSDTQPRHVVIGTAGHVDHGKTALVKLLTGVDTDRWAEEKRRGITIDLGFAPLALGGELHASIVDVPGHEDFVRNMVAGATGIDVALLVVAADEGVMPQTTEHLAILEMLAVPAGVVAITKADLVDAEWLALVQDDVAERLAKTTLTWEPPVVTSVVTGHGLTDVLEALARAARRARRRAEHDLFRLPIDRVFSVAGAGTVVTGTTWSGVVRVGDTVRVLPGDHASRIRSIQVHEQPRDVAEPGRRTALALPDVSKDAVQRGSVAVAGSGWAETMALDALVTLLPAARPLTQRSRVRVHLGTAEVLARVTPAEAAVAPGASGAVRLRLEAPIVARWGDRGVLRSYSPVTTIGGLVVIDPAPPLRPRRPTEIHGRSAQDPVQRLAAFGRVAPKAGLAVDALPVRLGLEPGDVAGVVQRANDADLVLVGQHLVRRGVLEQAHRAVLDALSTYHKRQPLAPGMPLEELRAEVDPPFLADHVQAELAARGAVKIEGSVARLADHAAKIPEADLAAAQELKRQLAEAGRHGLAVKELDGAAAGERAHRLLEHFVRQGTARRVRDRYYTAAVLDELIRSVLALIEERGQATPAEVRDRLGLTRKTLIPLLEWLDEQGITVRRGDARVRGR